MLEALEEAICCTVLFFGNVCEEIISFLRFIFAIRALFWRGVLKYIIFFSGAVIVCFAFKNEANDNDSWN